MSRSPNNLLAIGIGTREVAVGVCESRIERLRTLLRQGRVGALSLAGIMAPPAIVTHRSVPIPSGRWYAEAGALDALRVALAEPVEQPEAPATRHGNQASIVLDDFWGYHGVLRGDFRSMRKRDVEEVARAYFADAFGLDGASVAIAIAVQSGGGAVFASATPQSLLAGVREVCAAAGVKVVSLAPRLPRLLDRARLDVVDGQGMLVVAADDLLQVVLTDGRHWLAYDAQRLFSEHPADDAELAAFAGTMFERWSDESASHCTLYLGGNTVEASAFDGWFAGVQRLNETGAGAASPALGLMELAS